MKKWVPENLQIFLGRLFPLKLKQLSFRECNVQTSRHKSMIAPIPFGICVQLDKYSGTKWFVDHLAKFVFQ